MLFLSYSIDGAVKRILFITEWFFEMRLVIKHFKLLVALCNVDVSRFIRQDQFAS